MSLNSTVLDEINTFKQPVSGQKDDSLLSVKSDNLKLIPRTHMKKPDVMVYICNSRTPKVCWVAETGNFSEACDPPSLE